MNKILVILLVVAGISNARIGKEPPSQLYNILSKSQMEIYQLPSVDVQKLLMKNSPKDFEAKPLKFATPNPTKITTKSHGIWTDITGGKIWNLRFSSKNATDINFGFTKFHLPKGVELYLLSFADDPVYYDGPYTSEDNQSYKQFWSAPLPGGDVAIELFVPDYVKESIELELTRVSTGFRDVFKRYNGDGLIPKQGSCNNDVVCPVGDPWRSEIQSVSRYTINGSGLCTGSLIMDAERSFTPYYLTAAHCGLTPSVAPTVVTFWNYESINCGDLSGGSLLQTVSGATFKARRVDVDMSLIELSSAPPQSFNPYFSGWDNSGITPTGSVGIHHPNGDEKAISFNTDPLTTQNSCVASIPGINSHWEVNNWEDGTTEPGSSGSGLWDPDTHLLVGFLSGGAASCGNPGGLDCYGKFSVAWDDGSGAAFNLKPWLDPNNTGVTSVAGSDPIPFSLTLDNASIEVCNGDNAVGSTVNVVTNGVFTSSVALTTPNTPAFVSGFSFVNNTINPTPGSSAFMFDVGAGGTTGVSMLTIQGDGMDMGMPVSANVDLSILYSGGTTSVTALTSPTDNAIDEPVSTTFTWVADANATGYRLMVSTDLNFSTLLIDETVTGTNFSATGLPGATQLYWKVATQSACNGSDVESSVFTFTTVEVFCATVPVSIPDNTPAGVDLTIPVAVVSNLDSLTVSVKSNHTWVGDLIFTLSHGATSVELMNRPGVPASTNGCNADGVDVIFDDNSIIPVEDECAAPIGIAGTLAPNSPLSAFAGQSFAGNWVLNVSDNVGADTGDITEFCIVPTIVSFTPAITVTKTATLTTDTLFVGEADLNDVITFNVSVENTGDVALDTLVVNDSMGGVLTCAPTALAPTEIATCSAYTYTVIQADIDLGGTIDNTATATMTDPGDASNYMDSAMTQTAINQALFKDGFE